MYALLILAIAIAGLAYFFWRRHAKQQAQASLAQAHARREKNRFHCVEIRSRGGACAQVKQHAGIRYLSAEAPRLPLDGCFSARCDCRYVHHNDRRRDDRRLDFGSMTNTVTAGLTGERRRIPDRRKYARGDFKPRLVS